MRLSAKDPNDAGICTEIQVFYKGKPIPTVQALEFLIPPFVVHESYEGLRDLMQDLGIEETNPRDP